MFTVKRAIAPRSRAPKTNKHLSLRKYEATVGFLFLLPWLLGFLIFKALPILACFGFFLYKFQDDRTGKNPIHRTGQLPDLFQGFLCRCQPCSGRSVIFSCPSRLKWSWRSSWRPFLPVTGCAASASCARFSFMPSIIPATAIFIIIVGLTSPNNGWIIRLFHLSSSTPLYTLFPLILSLWTIGPGFLIMLGAMQAIPKELYEAARVDGAGPINRFISITIPMSSPAIFFSLVINMISSFGGVALLDRGLSYSQPGPGFFQPCSNGILHCLSNVLLYEPGICQRPGLDHVHPGHGHHDPPVPFDPLLGLLPRGKQ